MIVNDMIEPANALSEQATEETSPQTPFRIFVSYVIGKDKFDARVLSTPFEDIDNVHHFAAVAQALGTMHAGKRITILNWRQLEG
jgi:hypothetical protein